MIQNIDLLVHVGAPSSYHDDEKYQAQAKAYLHFQGNVISRRLHSSGPDLGALSEEGAHHTDVADMEQTTILENDTTAFLDDTQLAYNALDSQLVTSSLVLPTESDTRSSPHPSDTSHADITNVNGTLHFSEDVQRPSNQISSANQRNDNMDSAEGLRKAAIAKIGNDKVDERAVTVQRASTTPEEALHSREISQSSYLKSPVLERPWKKRKLSPYFPDNAPSAKPTASRYISLLEDTSVALGYVGTHPIANSKRANNTNVDHLLESHSGNETTSELPTSYSLSDITSESSRARNRRDVSQRSASDPGPRVIDIDSNIANVEHISKDVLGRADECVTKDKDMPAASTENARATSAPIHLNEGQVGAAARLGIEKSRPAGPRKPNLKTPSPKKGTPKLPTYPTQPPTTTPSNVDISLIINSLSKQIHPPPPPPGQGDFTTHITTSLDFLSTNIYVENSYKPISVAREIRPLERGYWRIDPSSYASSSWTLQAQVEFWRFLEKTVGSGNAGWGVWCERCERDDEENGENGVDVGLGLGIIKVWCWGEVVKHVYLVLHAASTGQVRKLGLRWVDGNGEVVVRMRGG